jgi:peptide/nickel transport system substrate-binding protein
MLGSPEVSRRAVLTGLVASGVLLGAPAIAAPSVPVGGRLTVSLPWPVGSLDPHALDDVVAALLGDAVFETLYTLDAGGRPVPNLAEALPEASSKGLRIALRPQLRTARGKVLAARDALFSWNRARAAGARGWLAPFPTPRAEGALGLRFGAQDGLALATALASPLTAIVPSSFTPTNPDGTGPLAAAFSNGNLVLGRSSTAVVPSYLDELVLRPAADLSASLRSFETGADDIGWLGAGLHEPRAGARPFDAGAIAWALLRTGKDAGSWNAPGIAQRLADGLPPERLAYLGLGPPWTRESEQGWGGAPGEILVRDDSPWLLELARAIAGTLSRPQHELTAKPVSPADFRARRSARAFALAVDVARPLSLTPFGALVTFVTADEPAAAEDAARHPPRLGAVPLRTLTRLRRVGVVGEVRAQGAHVGEAVLPALVPPPGIDWAAAFRPRRG